MGEMGAEGEAMRQCEEAKKAATDEAAELEAEAQIERERAEKEAQEKAAE